MTQPKYKIGYTVVLKRRWFLLFTDFVLCEIVAGRWVTDPIETEVPEWRYTLKIGNQFRRFCMWESEL